MWHHISLKQSRSLRINILAPNNNYFFLRALTSFTVHCYFVKVAHVMAICLTNLLAGERLGGSQIDTRHFVKVAVIF